MGVNRSGIKINYENPSPTHYFSPTVTYNPLPTHSSQSASLFSPASPSPSQYSLAFASVYPHIPVTLTVNKHSPIPAVTPTNTSY